MHKRFQEDFNYDDSIANYGYIKKIHIKSGNSGRCFAEPGDISQNRAVQRVKRRGRDSTKRSRSQFSFRPGGDRQTSATHGHCCPSCCQAHMLCQRPGSRAACQPQTCPPPQLPGSFAPPTAAATHLTGGLAPLLPRALVPAGASLLHCQVSNQTRCKPAASVCCGEGPVSPVKPWDCTPGRNRLIGADQPSTLGLRRGKARRKARKSDAAHGGGRTEGRLFLSKVKGA